MQAARKRRVPTMQARMRRVVAIPMVVLMVVWLTVSGFLFSRAIFQIAAADAADDLLIPSAIALTSVMDERSASVGYLEEPRAHQAPLDEARDTVDENMSQVLDRFEDLSPFLEEEVQQRVADLGTRFTDLETLRDRVDGGEAGREEILTAYTALTRAGADLFEEQARLGAHPASMSAGMSATDLFRTVDLFSLADARLSEAFATGELPMADQHEFAELTGGFHARIDVVTEYLGPEQTRRWEELRQSPEWERLLDMERQIIDREMDGEVDPLTGEIQQQEELPVGAEEWSASFDEVKAELTELGAGQAGYAAGVSRDAANGMLLVAFLVSAGILTVFIMALVLARWTAAGIVERLFRLRDETRALADERLPDIVRRLGEGDRVDVSAELPELQHEADEIGEVARSFNAAQRTAVAAAVRQAEIHHGANRVFVSVAHRSRALVHRQLRLLDKLEREQEEPQHLTELFKLDHLATRSRRHAENLLILGGESPGQRRNTPLPLVDVLRAAISESGDYSRIDRRHVAQVSLRGTAVADIIHLVAELLDNATAFSPPHTQVRLSAERVPKGVVVEVEDRGIGMREEEFTQANALLATQPQFDVLRLEEDLRLGLFVVSWLAHRHGIYVHLRPSPYGGVQAIVLLPPELIDSDGPAELEDGGRGEPAPADPPAERETPLTPRTPTASELERLLPAEEAAPENRPDPPPHRPEEPPAERPRLPRRAPQANLAPQLKAETPEPAAAARKPGTGTLDTAGADNDAIPSAEDEARRLQRLRTSLSAFQQGTERGRAAHREPGNNDPSQEER